MIEQNNSQSTPDEVPAVTEYLKCPDCGHECPLTDAMGKTVQEPLCPKCLIMFNRSVRMLKVDAEGLLAEDMDAKTPVLTGKDMNALLYLLLDKVGTIEIPQEVFNSVPGPERLKIEMQWDGVNKVWRFFIMRNRTKKKNNLILHRNRGKIILN